MSNQPVESMVLSVRDVASLMGCSPKAIYHAVERQVDWLPPPFRRGRRLAWQRADVINHIKLIARRRDATA